MSATSTTKRKAALSKKATKLKARKPQPVWLRKPMPSLESPAPVEGSFASQAPPCLLDRQQVCAIANVTFPTIWSWMRAGTFPRSRSVGAKSMWFSSEVEAWMRALPVRRLKGDDAEAAS